jgi:hypothetical protein
MTKEERFVVKPLQEFLLDKSRSGGTWTIKGRPKHGKSATGWDLQAERKNQVLLFEAKYVTGPFAAALAGLVIAPLTKRKETMKSSKTKSWSAVVAWAIGRGYKNRNRAKDIVAGIYQPLLDYLVRNAEFWECYSRVLRVKYVYFVVQGTVAKIRFDKLIRLTKQYATAADLPLSKRRARAQELLSFLVFK